jgi:23S rRNA (cytosine1962-C5)-methyltransferase
MQKNELLKKLTTAIEKREALMPYTNALRLVNSRGDGLPGLVIDRYNRHFMVQELVSLCRFDVRPVIAFLLDRFDPDYLILKQRASLETTHPVKIKTTVFAEKSGSATTVVENGLSFHVDLNDGLNTGLFLDMRKNRKIIALAAQNRELLNCFSYTCSFGVYGCRYGAHRVINVDMSEKALERGKKNYSLNNIPAPDNEFIRSDCLKFLKSAYKRKNFFDLVILDPPTFSRSKGRVFLIKKNLPELIASSLKILNENGSLFVATNCSSLTDKNLEARIYESSLLANRRIRFMQVLGQDIDFPGNGTISESHLAAFLVGYD